MHRNSILTNILDQHQKVFEYFGLKSNAFWMLWAKSITFWMFWVKIWYFLNILYKNLIFFRMIVYKYDTCWILSLNINTFECFGPKSYTFQMFWAKIRYLSNVLGPNQILLEVSYIIYTKPFEGGVYEYWRWNCVMCCVEIQWFSNVFGREQILFKYFA